MKKIIAYFGLALELFRGNWGHTLLSILGIVIGVAALVSILSLGDGMEQYGRSQILNTTDLQQIALNERKWREMDGIRVAKDTFFQFDCSVCRDLYDRYQNWGSITKSAQWRGLVGSGQDTSKAGAIVTGVWYLGTDGLPDLDLIEGVFISPDDSSSNIVINERLASLLFSDTPLSEVISNSIHIRSQNFRVVGVQKNIQPDGPAMAFVPLSQLEQIIGKLNSSTRFLVQDVEQVQNLKDSLESHLSSTYGLNSSSDFQIITNESRLEQISRGIFFFKLIMGLITGISVLVGGIGIMNVLLMSISERTREIGIRKAIGANRRDISLQFMIESLALSIMGSLLGLLLGLVFVMVATPIIRNLSEAQFYAGFSIQTGLIIFGIAVFIGLFFGTYPAWIASRMTPVEAIRHE